MDKTGVKSLFNHDFLTFPVTINHQTTPHLYIILYILWDNVQLAGHYHIIMLYALCWVIWFDYF